MLGVLLTAVLIFNDIGKINIGQNEDQATIQNQPKILTKLNYHTESY